jgi:hypothetical protein
VIKCAAQWGPCSKGGSEEENKDWEVESA